MNQLMTAFTAASIATLAAACAPMAAPPTSSDTTASFGLGVDMQTLASTNWQPVSLNGHALGDHAKGMIMTFKDGKISGNMGCNRFGGDYTVETGRLVTNGVATTRMGCPKVTLADGTTLTPEDEFFPILNVNPTLSLSAQGVLSLIAPDGRRATFTKM